METPDEIIAAAREAVRAYFANGPRAKTDEAMLSLDERLAKLPGGEA